MTKKLIIFDFDNCIVDIRPISRKVLAQLGPRYKKNDIDLEKVLYEEGMEAVIAKSGISLWRIPLLTRKFRKYMGNHFHEVKAIPGMLGVLNQLKKEGHTLGILTSNSYDNVETFLEKNNIEKDFKFIKANVSLFIKSWYLRRILQKHKIKKQNAIMIGDETRDIAAANKAGIKSVAVTWGINSETILAKQNPTYIAKKPKEILKFIK